MNKYKLKSHIALNNDNVKKLSKFLELSPNSFYQKLNEKTDWRLNKIKKIKKRYQLDAEMIDDIFFK